MRSGYSFKDLSPSWLKTPGSLCLARPLERDPHGAALRSLKAATRCGRTGVLERSSCRPPVAAAGPLRPTDRPTAAGMGKARTVHGTVRGSFPETPSLSPSGSPQGGQVSASSAVQFVLKSFKWLFGKRSASAPLCVTNEPEGLSTCSTCGQVGYAHKPLHGWNGAEGAFGLFCHHNGELPPRITGRGAGPAAGGFGGPCGSPSLWEHLRVT